MRAATGRPRIPPRRSKKGWLAVGLLAVPLTLAATPLTLEDAVNLALRQNRALARDALGVATAETDVIRAQQAFAPAIRPQASLGLAGEERLSTYALAFAQRFTWGTAVEARAERTHGETFDDTPVDFTRLAVSVRQPLFRNAGPFVNTAAVVQAGQELDRVRRRHELEKASLVVAVVRAYEDALRLEHQVRSDEAALARTEAHHRLVRAKEAAGRASRVDVLRAELQHGQARSRLAADRARLTASQRELAELLGLPPQTELTLAPASLFEFDAPDTAQAIAVALANRLDYAQAQQDRLAAEREERLARRRLLPDLDVVARYERFTEALSPGEEALYGRGGLSLGIEGGFDAYPAADRSALRRAEFTAAAAREGVRVVELAVAREVQNALLAYRRAHAEIEVATRNFELAGLRLRLARRLFALGRGDSFTVSEAEVAYAAAESALLEARTETTVRGYELLRSLGTLLEVPAELKPLPAGVAP